MSDLQSIPGVGKNMEQHLFDIGVHTIQDLVGKDPEALYERSCAYAGQPVDRCVLYVYRLAVRYAESDDPKKHTWRWWDPQFR